MRLAIHSSPLECFLGKKRLFTEACLLGGGGGGWVKQCGGEILVALPDRLLEMSLARAS